MMLNSCYFGRSIIWNVADIHDYKKFASVSIPKSSRPFQFIEGANSGFKLPPLLSDSLMCKSLDRSKTVAFLVIRNDSILYEYYADGYSANSIVPSFSVAKSFISLLTGIAIDEGYIKSWDEPITNYITELDENEFGKIKIKDLLDMRSGILFNEGYLDPFSDAAKYYYGLNLKKFMTKLKIMRDPDEHFDYRSVNTQLLAWVIEKATRVPVEEYFRKKVWEPLGMEYDASWSIDSKKSKTIKAFCCLNARARDLAKLGRLYLNNGNWNGKQIVSEQWVECTTEPELKNNLLYSYGWWHNYDLYYMQGDSKKALSYRISNRLFTAGPKNTSRWLSKSWLKNIKIFAESTGDFYAEGLLGQFVYVNPSKNLIIVRLGKKNGFFEWPRALLNIAKNS